MPSVSDAAPWGKARSGLAVPAGMDRYRVTDDEGPSVETEIDRANKIADMAAALLFWDRDVPAESVSWKFLCPWDFEHADENKLPTKTARYYGAANAAMCFKMHGWLTPVRLRAREWKMPQVKAAKRILREAGEGAPGWYRQRWYDMQARIEQRTGQRADPQYAVAALHVALSAVEGYAVRQYDESVRGALEAVLEELVDGLTAEEMRAWVERSATKIRTCL